MNKQITISEGNFMFMVAGQLFSQAPNKEPRRAEIIMRKVRDNFRKQAKSFKEYYYIELEYNNKSEIFDFISNLLMSIEEFQELNLSQIELDQGIKVDDPSRSKFSFHSMYDKVNSESWKNDFVDLDAFIRNVYTNIMNHIERDR